MYLVSKHSECLEVFIVLIFIQLGDCIGKILFDSANITSKMATCGVCSKSLNKNQLKINCVDCNSNFHGTCVKISKQDLEVMSNEGTVWRCEPCGSKRRKSLRLEMQATEGDLTLEDVMKAIRDLAGEQKKSISEFNTSYEVLNTKLDENTSVMKEQSNKIDEYLKQIETLTVENKALKEKVQLLENRLDDAEQYSRANCIEIQGVPTKHDDVMETVKNIGQALGIQVTEPMIDACHILGNQRNTNATPGIIVKFVRRFDAENFISKRRQKRDFSTRHLGLPTDNPVYINESLTPTRRKLLSAARDLKRRQGCKWVWVRGGKILLRKEENGPVTVIRSQADLLNV